MTQADFKSRKRFATVLGKRMAYLDEGAGETILFLHGNPTSSYLWRDVMPAFEGMGRLVAPDLIGMGDSEKLAPSGPSSYAFVEHRRYLDALLDTLDLGGRITLVLHDWGSALGFHWAQRHAERVKAIAFMDSFVCPDLAWDDFIPMVRETLQAFRSPAGETLVLQENAFVEKLLLGTIPRQMSEAEKAEYRRPFANLGEDRRPTLSWPRQIPIGGEPEDTARIVAEYTAFLAESPIPKFFVDVVPGVITPERARAAVRRWPAVTETRVSGNHFVQEEAGLKIGQEIAQWLRSL